MIWGLIQEECSTRKDTEAICVKLGLDVTDTDQVPVIPWEQPDAGEVRSETGRLVEARERQECGVDCVVQSAGWGKLEDPYG